MRRRNASEGRQEPESGAAESNKNNRARKWNVHKKKKNQLQTTTTKFKVLNFKIQLKFLRFTLQTSQFVYPDFPTTTID